MSCAWLNAACGCLPAASAYALTPAIAASSDGTETVATTASGGSGLGAGAGPDSFSHDQLKAMAAARPIKDRRMAASYRQGPRTGNSLDPSPRLRSLHADVVPGPGDAAALVPHHQGQLPL